MKISKRATAIALTLSAAAAITAAVAAPASAATTNNGSDAPVYVVDNGSGDYVAPSTALGFRSADISITASATDPLATFACGTGTSHVYTFWAAQGNERTQASWKAYADNGTAVAGDTILLPNISAFKQIAPTAAAMDAVEAAGGVWSAGVACVSASSQVVNAWYLTMHVTAKTSTAASTYAFDSNVSTSTPTPTPTATATPLPGTQTGSLNITSTQEAGADGGVQLIMPSNTNVVLSPAAKENGHAVSTGTLPNIQVKDQNFSSLKGWNLTTSVANFVNASDSTKTIAATNLGFTPVAVSSEPNPISLGTAQVAGSAAFPTAVSFASLADNFTLHNLSETGLTTLNGNLKLVSPAGAPAGTYNSTMTLTLVPNN